MIVNLFTTVGCHLCDQALYMLRAIPAVTVNEIEIANSEDLLDRYGVRIPVVTVNGGTDELGWPFTTDELQLFLGEQT